MPNSYLSTNASSCVKRALACVIGVAIFTVSAFAQARPAPRDSFLKYLADSNTVIEARLVALALKSPEIERVERQNKIVDYQLQAAKSQWLNLLTLSGNYNEQTFAKQNPNSQVVYPKFFFGFSLPLGTLLSRSQVKSTRESVEIGKLSRIETERKLKAEVLTKYRQYKAQLEILSIENGYMTDLRTAYLQAEDRFRKNQGTFEAFSTAARSVKDQEIKLIGLRQQLETIKLDIERIIGTDDLDRVLRGQ